MNCPGCGHHAEVKDSRQRDDGTTRRRRICGGCGMRFTTYERRDAAFVVDLPGASPEQRRDANELMGVFPNLLMPERAAVLALARHFQAARAANDHTQGAAA